jgi:hypothetical protein
MQRPILKTVGVVSLLVAISSVAAIAGGLFNSPPAWFLVCFEMVVLLAAAFGVLAGRGRFAESLPMTLLCVGGAIAVSSALGYLGADRQLLGRSLKLFLLARMLAAGFLVAVAAADVLRHDRRSLGVLARGLACGALPLGMLAAYWKGMGASTLASMDGTVRALLYIFAFLALGAMICASVHLVVRAFQLAAKAAGAQRT